MDPSQMTAAQLAVPRPGLSHHRLCPRSREFYLSQQEWEPKPRKPQAKKVKIAVVSEVETEKVTPEQAAPEPVPAIAAQEPPRRAIPFKPLKVTPAHLLTIARIKFRYLINREKEKELCTLPATVLRTPHLDLPDRWRPPLQSRKGGPLKRLKTKVKKKDRVRRYGHYAEGARPKIGWSGLRREVGREDVVSVRGRG